MGAPEGSRVLVTGGTGIMVHADDLQSAAGDLRGPAVVARTAARHDLKSGTATVWPGGTHSAVPATAEGKAAL